MDKSNLAKRAKQFSYKKLRYISIDEIAIKKGHKYMKIFTDISTGQIIYAVEGRREEDLKKFLRLLSKKAKRLRGIGIDMSAAYSSAIKKHLPHTSIISENKKKLSRSNRALLCNKLIGLCSLDLIFVTTLSHKHNFLSKTVSCDPSVRD